MKKTLFLSLIATVLMFTFIACSDDDDNTVDASIVGSWEDTNYYDGTLVWTFNSNGKGTLKVTEREDYGSYTASFTFTYDGQTLKITGKEDGEIVTYTYTVTISSDGKTMRWVDNDGGDTTILKKK
jgi:hypothetical protein